MARRIGGKSPRETYSSLREYQRRYPQVTITDLFAGTPPHGHEGVVALYATRGLIIDSIYRQSGIAGLRRFAEVGGPPSDIIKILPNYINGIAGDIDRWWRARTDSILRH